MTWTYRLDAVPGGSVAEAAGLVGGKAANLAVMARDLGLPVPPGFVISTEVCRAFLAAGWPDGLDDEIRARMAELEAEVGRRFGDASDPLLVSVRSGAPVSMPGMMDTILDLGLNDATTAGLGRAVGDERFAAACRERFETSFRSIVGAAAVPGDPWDQLRLAVQAVFRSWNSDRARTYRTREGIADDLGTAVTVQAMVFGNRGPTSGTGVVFTRNPATGEPTLYGDVLFDAQGEDVVAGTHATHPIAALAERLPDVWIDLQDFAARLERHYRDLCDIEFTIEEARLWMLQVRVGKRSPQAALRMAVDMAEDEGFPLSREEAVHRVLPLLADPPRVTRPTAGQRTLLATGLPASPGIGSGPIATSAEAAIALADTGSSPILVRPETSPDDVHGMARSAGIVTARGGLASHAAVVARGWGIPAVVGAAGIGVRDGEVTFGDRVLESGDVITVDGSSGEVFAGVVDRLSEPVPEARTLLRWARELGIGIGEAGASPEGVAAPGRRAHVTPDGCVRAIAIKGFAPLAGLADALLSTPGDVRPVAEALASDGFLATAAGAYRLTGKGEVRARELLDEERESWGVDAASDALDAFLSLDGRMKETVTAWQLRAGAGEPVPNDHSDAAYDRSVLDALAALHADAVAWLRPLESSCPRLATYRVRLERALEQVREGDGRYVASPRVDSYHGVWFELHEDLIQLAGRTRSGEVAAGRA